MPTVKTNKILRKLEKIVNFRVGKPGKYPIVLQAEPGAATDGNQIFLSRKEGHFKSERDNELSLANSTAHEADHIREFNEYFGDEVEGLREQEASLVEEFGERNFSELTENPALASWIENIVSDRRIDAQRREQLLGVKRFYKKVFDPCAEYFRPSVKRMSKLDAFREQYLQKALLGKTVEPVPEEYQQLLEEVVELTYSTDSIHKDKDVVAQIYQKFKENFDIKQKMSRLPSLFGRGRLGGGSGRGKPRKGNKGKETKPKKSSKKQGDGAKPKDEQNPQGGYGKEIKPREGRSDKDKKPKMLSGDKIPKDDLKDKTGNTKKEGIPRVDEKDREGLYKHAGKESGVSVHMVNPNFSDEVIEAEHILKERYAGEISSMKRIFRRLMLKHYGEKRDFEGHELNYEEFLQSELEYKITGIKGNGRVFRASVQNQQRPAWAVLADISPSTDPDYYNIIKQIKASLLIQGEALGVTDFPFGLFAFSGDVCVIKDFTEKYSPEIANKIISVKRHNSGTYLAPSLRVVGSLLRRQKEQPKGITIMTDGEPNNVDDSRRAIKELYDQKIFPFLVVIGEEFEGHAQYLTADIGEEYYSIIDRDKVYELPDEIFRLFKTYGIAK